MLRNATSRPLIFENLFRKGFRSGANVSVCKQRQLFNNMYATTTKHQRLLDSNLTADTHCLFWCNRVRVAIHAIRIKDGARSVTRDVPPSLCFRSVGRCLLWLVALPKSNSDSQSIVG
jgi:hypothetical protein